jgi:predicted lipid carrier protein YhbT
VATTEEVEERLRELIARLDRSGDGARSLGRALPERRVLSLRVPDLDRDYWTELEEGRLSELRDGPAEDAHIRVTASSNELVDLVDGKGSLFSAYMAGRVRIEASLSDLLRLRKLI